MLRTGIRFRSRVTWKCLILFPRLSTSWPKVPKQAGLLLTTGLAVDGHSVCQSMFSPTLARTIAAGANAAGVDFFFRTPRPRTQSRHIGVDGSDLHRACWTHSACGPMHGLDSSCTDSTAYSSPFENASACKFRHYCHCKLSCSKFWGLLNPVVFISCQVLHSLLPPAVFPSASPLSFSSLCPMF